MVMELYSPSTALSNCIVSRLRALLIFQRLSHTVPEVGGQTKLYSDVGHGQTFVAGSSVSSSGTVLDSRKLGIDRKKIPQSPYTVLRLLKQQGFDAYLVGGCVRDLLLHKVPKDYDIITTAKLLEIRNIFHRCQIVGRRFPICRVHMKGSVVEVSSFETASKQAKGKGEFISPQMPRGRDKSDLLRRTDSIRRDFTINSLFFNPLDDKIYDYTNALSDLWSSKLRTLIPAQKSFQDDCARILRGLRLAARLNFSFSKETENAIHRLGSSIQSLAQSRIVMELDYMLSYGAAEPSLKLLHRFHLLDILLPIQAAYLNQQASKRPGKNSLMLLKLFANLDQLVGCDRPAHGCLWVSLIAFHQALIIKPQSAVVVMAFASVLYHGNWEEGVQFARRHAKAMHIYEPEMSDCLDSILDDKLANLFSQFEQHLQGSVKALTESIDLQTTMRKFPKSACPGLVFVSKKLGKDAMQIFQIHQCRSSLNMKRKNQEINYDSLGKGDILEARFVLGKIIVNTLISDSVQEEVVKQEKDASHILDFRQRAKASMTIHPAVANSREHQPPLKIDRSSKKQVSEEGQKVSKKQKLVESETNLSERGRNSKEKDAGNEQSGDVLTIHTAVANSREHQPPLKIDRSSKKQVSEEGQKVSKKQKLVESETNLSERGRNSKEKDAGNEQSGDVLTIHTAVANSREHQPPMKKNKPRKKQLLVSEEGQKVSKKQKLVVSKTTLSEREGIIKGKDAGNKQSINELVESETNLSERGRNSKEKDAGNKQSGDVLTIHTAVANSREHQPPMKKNKPRKKQLIASEEGQKVSKKQKLVVSETTLSEREGNIKGKDAGNKQSINESRKQKKLVEDCIDMDGRHFGVRSEGIGCVLDKLANKTQEKVDDSHHLPQRAISIMLNTFANNQSDPSVEGKKHVDDSRDKRMDAKDFLKILDDLSDDDRKSEQKCRHLPGDSCIEQSEVVASRVDERDGSQKSMKKKNAKETKQKSSQVKLSGLF